ncbi:hypothetical protein BGW42_002913 [Actinomortierella wolfii]|nr:hypothetical protein BGW42_002913 [Actinomortierella wolfii]
MPDDLSKNEVTFGEIWPAPRELPLMSPYAYTHPSEQVTGAEFEAELSDITEIDDFDADFDSVLTVEVQLPHFDLLECLTWL